MPSTLLPPEIRSGASWIACAGPEIQKRFLTSLTNDALLALPYLFAFWAHPHQMPPDGEWKSWVILGGRGAGKTRAGAEWVRHQVEGPRPMDPGRAVRVALVGETLDQVRDIMVFGDSGIVACSPPDRRPIWQASRNRLVWPNGATAQAFSAHSPESLRGPQFDAAWVDELAKWRKLRDTWDMLQFGLRLGRHPQQCITTTPRNVDVLKEVLATKGTVVTIARTDVNRAYLADSFLEEVRARYGGTRLGRQELDGVLLDDVEGALWSSARLAGCLVEDLPEMDRIVVAVDPPVTGNSDSDECGIVVAGVVAKGPPQTWWAYVLADASVQGVSPTQWARAAIRAMDAHGADRLVAEVNQGGELVQTVIRQIDPMVPFKGVHASRSKSARAEPVAALYEQGRVHHVRGLGALEDQMCQMTGAGYRGKGSPDRVDALVWAITELVLGPANTHRRPGIRSL